MSQTFNTAIWGPWEAHLLNMLVSHAGRMINPCDDCFLGSLLTNWFQAQSVYDQHDAGEFAGWFRQSLLEKTLPQYMQAGWSARLEHSIEDAANVFAPIPLACDATDFVMLQQLIHNWHHQKPFVHALECDSPFQISCFTHPGIKNHCSVEWDDTIPLKVPVFCDRQGLQVEWYEVIVTAGVTHKGEGPSHGHNQCILWHSGTVLECDDRSSKLPLGFDSNLAKTIYLLWMVPSRLTSQLWRRPLRRPAKSLDELLGDRFA